jgi:prolipoprotein diacylglyceryltransferase
MAALLVLAFVLIRWRRRRVPDVIVLGRYFLIAGAIRFAIEFVRVNQRVLGPFTVAHLISAGLMVAGLVLIARRRSRPAG